MLPIVHDYISDITIIASFLSFRFIAFHYTNLIYHWIINPLLLHLEVDVDSGIVQ